jgi:DNA processing protein
MATDKGVRLQELALWAALCSIRELSSAETCHLLRTFGDPQAVFNASHAQLRQVIPDAIAKRILSGPDEGTIAATTDWLQTDHNHLVTLADPEYPRSLLEIADPPPVLFAKGHLKWLNTQALAITGSHNASSQGEQDAENFALALAELGYTIISGLGLGTDAAAHRGALKANGGTIAIVGTGLDIVYPARNRGLAHQIAGSGLILSEFPLGTPSSTQNFLQRSRIMSGIACGCLVVEANIRSDALMVARLAAEQGREVFAIPGSIHSPLSKGCHQLIKEGAKLVDNIHDIVDEFQEGVGANIFTPQ